MIVTCEQCTTQFKLDDAKIPSGGARVRCSRCQHAFHIEPPDQDDHVRIDDLTRDALTRESAADSAPDSAIAGDEAEADWKFNEDAPAASEPEAAPNWDAAGDEIPDLAAARDAVDDLLGGDPSPLEGPAPDLGAGDLGGVGLEEGDFGESGLDLALPDTETAMLNDSEMDSGIGAESGSEIESESPMADLAGPDVALAGDLDASDPLGIGAELDDEPTGIEAPTPAVQAGSDEGPDFSSVVDALDAASDVDDDLGSPRNWDFFADSEGDGSGSDDAEKTAVARVGLVPRWKLLEQEQAAEQERENQALLDTAATSDLQDARGRMSRLLGHAGNGIGWAATLALIAAALWTSVGPGQPGGEQAARVQTLGPFEAEVVRAHWIDNAVTGPLYVVSGQLRSIRGGDAVAVGGLGIELLDASGASLGLPPAPVGIPLNPIHLREHTPAALAEGLEAGARDLAKNQLRAGDALPFQALFSNLPPTAVRFRLTHSELTPEPPPHATPTEPGAGPQASPAAQSPSA